MTIFLPAIPLLCQNIDDTEIYTQAHRNLCIQLGYKKLHNTKRPGSLSFPKRIDSEKHTKLQKIHHVKQAIK